MLFIGGPFDGEVRNQEIQGTSFLSYHKGKRVEYEYAMYDDDTKTVVAKYVRPKEPTPLLDRFKYEKDRYFDDSESNHYCEVSDDTYEALSREITIKAGEDPEASSWGAAIGNLYGAAVYRNNSVPNGTFKFSRTRPPRKYNIAQWADYPG